MSIDPLPFVVLLNQLLFFLSTCIIIIRTKTKIIAGADTKRTEHFLNPETGKMTKTIKDNYQKIHKVKNFYFAISGLCDDIQLLLATDLCNRFESLKEITKIFTREIKAYLQEAIEALRIIDKDWFRDRFSNGHVSGISFFCMQGDVPHLVTIYFDVKNRAEQKTKIVTREHLNSTVTFLGRRTNFNDPNDHEKRGIMTSNDEVLMDQIKKMIKIQIQYHPEFVGEPIQSLILDKDGDNWSP